MQFITLAILALTALYSSTLSSASPSSGIPGNTQPNLRAALNDAKSINCSDEVFMAPETSSPGLKWTRSKAQELLEALIWDWGHNPHGDFKSLSEFAADVLSSNSLMVESFQCNDDVSGDACTNYQPPPCDPAHGPAASMILTSFSVANYYFKNMNDALFRAEVDVDGLDISANFVSYMHDTHSSALNVLSMFAELILPVGAGQMFAATMKGAINTVTQAARDTEKAVAKSKFYVDQANNYKMQAQMFGFEVSDTATQKILEGGKDLIAGAESSLKEYLTFDDLKTNITKKWEEASQDVLGRLFSGTMTGDKIENGISDYASLLSIFANGAWSEKINATDTKNQAGITLYSQLIPLALYQNSKVRPTMIVRPYACDDATHQKLDTTFISWFPPENWKEVQVSLDKYPGLCFFMLDANEEGGGDVTDSNPNGLGNQQSKKEVAGLIWLPGINHSKLTGGSAFGGLTMDDFVESLYTGWLAAGRSNHVTPYKIDAQAAGGDPMNLWENPVRSPGLYNPYFNVCGSDDTKNYDWKAKVPDDMKVFKDNMNAATNDGWGKADPTKGFPCNPDL